MSTRDEQLHQETGKGKMPSAGRGRQQEACVSKLEAFYASGDPDD
jgi:hypothetical protein